MKCRRCDAPCDGSIIRTHPRHGTAKMLLGECPRAENGDLEVCHWCQRQAYFARGFVRLLALDLEAAARDARHRYSRLTPA